MPKRNRAIAVLDKQIQEAEEQGRRAAQQLQAANEVIGTLLTTRKQIAAAYERGAKPSKAEQRKAKAKAIVEAIAKEPGRAQEIAKEALAS